MHTNNSNLEPTWQLHFNCDMDFFFFAQNLYDQHAAKCIRSEIFPIFSTCEIQFEEALKIGCVGGQSGNTPHDGWLLFVFMNCANNEHEPNFYRSVRKLKCITNNACNCTDFAYLDWLSHKKNRKLQALLIQISYRNFFCSNRQLIRVSVSVSVSVSFMMKMPSFHNRNSELHHSQMHSLYFVSMSDIKRARDSKREKKDRKFTIIM